MAAGASVKVILGSLAANAALAISKAFAAWFTLSGAMLAEAIHSAADCCNQIFLLIGTKEAQKSPSKRYPMGHGRAAYFWTFLVALMIFFGGGVFAIREGLHKLSEPQAIENAWVGYIVLGAGTLFEGAALFQVIRALWKKKGKRGFWSHLGTSKDIDLQVLFAEDTAAVMGLLVALGALFAAEQTGDGRWDAYGSIAIGGILCLVAVWLAFEVKSLLQGEVAEPAIEKRFRDEVAKDPRFRAVLKVIAVQQGPNEVMLAAKVRMAPAIRSLDVAASINELEARVVEARPEVNWIFVEPDLSAEGK